MKSIPVQDPAAAGHTRRDSTLKPQSTGLPRFVLDLLSACPAAGNGVNNWLFRAARVLHYHYPNRAELAHLLASAAAGCGRPVKESEITRAIENSAKVAWHPNERPAVDTPARPKWPALDSAKRAKVIESGLRLGDLWEVSPVRMDSDEPQTELLVDLLFPGDPLLCCGESSMKFATMSREEWRGELSSLQFVVPSPMTARLGLTQEGKQSAHALSITGPRRFLVVEFDEGTADEHAALAGHLAAYAPLVLCVSSGNKSLHSWFHAEGQPEDKLKRFMDYAVSLGADTATWTRSQFVRMPDGKRSNGRWQVAYYFNPAALVKGGAQ